MEVACEKFSKLDEATAPALIMDELAEEIKDYKEKAKKDIAQTFKDELVNVNLKEMETSQEDQIIICPHLSSQPAVPRETQ